MKRIIAGHNHGDQFLSYPAFSRVAQKRYDNYLVVVAVVARMARLDGEAGDPAVIAACVNIIIS